MAHDEVTGYRRGEVDGAITPDHGRATTFAISIVEQATNRLSRSQSYHRI